MSVPSGDGPPNARVMLVGECWGYDEERTRQSFSGKSGQELNRLLHEAGIMRSECYGTNLINARPPAGDIEAWIAFKKKDFKPSMRPLREAYVEPIIFEGLASLHGEIDLVQPNIIIALGNYAMWALTGAKGIMKWRGSQLTVLPPPVGQLAWLPKLIPTVNPAYVMRDQSFWPMAVLDLKRAAREMHTKEYSNVPRWSFLVRPSYESVTEKLSRLFDELRNNDLWIDFDLETRAGHIACAGLSWSNTEAICIPFMCVEDKNGYWMAEQEAAIVYQLYKVLTHPNVRVRWQNGLYDAQYTYRHWHFVPRGGQDTMLTHHTAFAGLPKSLAFQASMYCDHYVYWKDDGKTWTKEMGEDQLWAYNGQDCVRTRECGEEEAKTIEKMGLQGPEAFQQKLFWSVLKCMQRGTAIDKKRRLEMAEELQIEISKREAFFGRILGHNLNPQSSPQMCKLFYDDLQQPRNMSRAKKGQPPHLTCDDEALEKIGKREPILRPLLRAIAEHRSLRVFLSTFVMAPLDVDGRMRTSYNICGTETYRLSSSENAFGSGTNLQNIPKGGDDDDSDLVLPNVRSIFVPDFGFTFFDVDLSKADLRIVAWESDERELKAMLKEGRDPYVETAREFYRDPAIKKIRDDGTEHPKYRIFKSFAHGTHYLGTPHGLAGRLGLTVHEADRTQRWYFGKYPAIQRWQEEFKRKVASRRYVENIFGYRRHYFGRIDDSTYREAIAWVPQSTVGIYINKIWVNIDDRYPHIWVLLQVHDSLAGQFPSHMEARAIEQIKQAGQIILPYDDPMTIPLGVKTSKKSWGDCG